MKMDHRGCGLLSVQQLALSAEPPEGEIAQAAPLTCPWFQGYICLSPTVGTVSVLD
jgi:hypothetical protein